MAHLEYCSNCGAKNNYGEHNGNLRHYCSKCGAVHYENPKPASTLICPRDNTILLVKRAFEPAKGWWCLPGGFIELKETPEDAGIRELKEETNLDGKINRFLGHCSHFNTMFGDILLMGMVVDVPDFSNLSCGDDASDAQFFSLDNLPKLAFPCHDKFVNIYRSQIKSEC